MDAVSSGHAAALWAGLHLFLLLTLSTLVVRQRRKHRFVERRSDQRDAKRQPGGQAASGHRDRRKIKQVGEIRVVAKVGITGE